MLADVPADAVPEPDRFITRTNLSVQAALPGRPDLVERIAAAARLRALEQPRIRRTAEPGRSHGNAAATLLSLHARVHLLEQRYAADRLEHVVVLAPVRFRPWPRTFGRTDKAFDPRFVLTDEQVLAPEASVR